MQSLLSLFQVNIFLVSLISGYKEPNVFEYFLAVSIVSLKYFQLQSDNHSFIHSLSKQLPITVPDTVLGF